MQHQVVALVSSLPVVGPAMLAGEAMNENAPTSGRVVSGVFAMAAVIPVVGGVAGELRAAEAPGVAAYEVGTFESLAQRSVVGDALDLHHVGQAHAMGQVVEGYSRATGPAIALPHAEHALIPNLRGPVSLTPRQLLARDIWNLRQYTNAPNSSLLEVIELNKQMYPEAFAR